VNGPQNERMRLTMIDDAGNVTKPTPDQMRAVAEKLRGSSCSSPFAGSVSDPYESSEYAAFVETMADKCHCDPELRPRP